MGAPTGGSASDVGGAAGDVGGASGVGASTTTGGSAQSSAGMPSGAEAGMGAAPSASGGVATGGEGGTGGASGPRPSPGCGSATPAPTYLEAELSTRVTAPATYDGVTPLPLLLVLHATNGGWEYGSLRVDPVIADNYVLAAPTPKQPASGNFESVQNAPATLTKVLDEVLATLCVDENRLFAVGNGSGGRVLTSWVAARDKAAIMPRFRALAVVGTYYGKITWQPTPLLFVHGLKSGNSAGVANDSDGMKAFKILSTANACGEATTTPVTAAACPGQGGVSVDPGCVDLSQCAAPLRFCHFDGPAESDTWPCFANAAISKFFEPLRQ
jgi:hypothetical protein